jgi:ADP-heptose:LPS heptosyltransferase
MFDVKLMRRIDNTVGNLACNVLAGSKKLRAVLPRSDRPIRKIAVAKFFGMGTVVVASPALAALRETYPDAEIHFVSFAGNREVIDILGVADKAWFVDNSSPAAFARSTFEVARGLRREKIDLLIDFEFFAKFPLVLGSLAGIPRSAGFCLTSEPWRRTLLDVPGSYNHYFHTRDIFLSLIYLLKTNDLYYLDFDEFRSRHDRYPRHVPAAHDLEAVRALLAARGIGNSHLVVINPNTSPDLAPEVRKWPEQRYAELAAKVLREYPDSFVAFIGAKSERAYVEHIASHVGSPRAASLAGELSIRQLLALFSMTDLFVSNDSGPMHLACLVDTPVIGLFFADSPTVFAPIASRARSVGPDLYSIPLFSVYNGKDVVAGTPLDRIENVAARATSVERVMEEVRSMLDEHPSVIRMVRPRTA